MHKFILLFLVLITTHSIAQQKYTISGTISEASSGETLPGAGVKIIETGSGAVTNLYGFYSISLVEGTYTVEYSYVGYNPEVRTVTLNENKKINIELKEDAIQLEEVVISSEKMDKNIKSVEMSVAKLDVEEIKKMPALLGEVDVVKSIQLLPGVSTVGEGATGFNVRGGSIDQNLILLDEAPVYSSSHLFGFFSVFNSDAVKDVKLYKGGIPAAYGGRISSVLDVRQKDGNVKKFAGAGGIGVVSSRLALEGPIVKDKASFLVAGRRSYADLFLKLSPDEDLNRNTAYFYDLNAKVNYRINDNNKVYVSGYFGRDVFRLGDDFGFDWGNYTTTVRWNHVFNDKLFGNFTTSYSKYDYTLGGDDFFTWKAAIDNMITKADFNYYASDKHKLDFGVMNTYYNFTPGTFTFSEQFSGIFDDVIIPNEYATELGAYIGDEYTMNDKISVQYGVRYSHFLTFGPRESITYTEGLPKSENTIESITDVNRGDVVANYGGFEPRLAIKYGLDSVSSIKFSYNRTRQYIHLISNTTSGLPIDIWKSSDEHIKPQIADQVAIGYFRNFKDNLYETSVEVYYKDLQNAIDYKNNAQLFFNPNLERELLTGIGMAYGAEFYVKKTTGKLTGWMSYTYSRSLRKADNGPTREEKINEGDWYASNFDKPHDLTLVGMYQLTDRWSLSANFTYSTGRPVTFPDGKYEYDGITVGNYVLRNQDRIPDYHRLDLSATLDNKKKEGRKWESSWTFSIYNVYARRNAFSITFSPDATDRNRTVVERLSILGAALPAVTYNFNF